MRKFVIAGHGRFSSGLMSAIELIIGKQDDVLVLDCYIDPKQNVEEDIEKIFNSVTEGTELICFTDILGGSVNNIFMKYIDRSNIYIFTGSSLPILLETFSNKEVPWESLRNYILDIGNKGFCLCNDISKEEEEDF